MTREEKFKMLMDSGEFGFLKSIPENELWKVFFMATFVSAATDVVPVVRCKDCTYWYPTTNNKGYCFSCSRWLKSDDFCSYGKRREVREDG